MAKSKKISSQNTAVTVHHLAYRLTNDYLFRALLQKNPKALEGLCRAILGAKPTDQVSAVIKNPIVLGEAIEDKEFILDILVEINHCYLINLEMQVVKDPGWQDRSLAYVCRCFDSLEHGEEYEEAPPVHHIGFLDFTLFPDAPEFFSTYKLLNVNNSEKVFNDKFTISVVELTHIELATEEDKVNSLDLWAKAFKATTWEELDMLAQNNEYIQSAVATVAELTEDEQIRQRLQARRDFEVRERKRIKQIQETKTELTEAHATIAEQAALLSEKDDKIKELEALLTKNGISVN